MKKNFWAPFCFLFFLVLSCSQKITADKIYVNAKLWTGDPDNVQASAIAIKDSIILFVGTDYATYKGKNTEIIHMHGEMIVPGFIDNHTHFLAGGYQLASVNLRNARSKKEFIRILS